ncbi:uncharacterized protein BNAC07G36710D isoform X2 [Brassica napus]|nr:uncharacterized protein BNAC07G36710D isoform X2 [Brassica napus]
MSFLFSTVLGREKKGNKTRNGLNTTAKEFIVKTFEEKYGEKHIWDRFKNKYDTCRRIYVSVKKLIHNRTGMGYDDMGRINMSDDWWQERIKEWPGARKYKNKHVPNIDLFEEKFGAITVTGAEGWSAQQEESSLDSRVSGNNDEEDDCTDMPPPVGDTQNKNGGSRSKRKRKEVDPSTENAARCNVILDEKNQLMGKMILLMERENLRSGERGVEILNDLPGVKK